MREGGREGERERGRERDELNIKLEGKMFFYLVEIYPRTGEWKCDAEYKQKRMYEDGGDDDGQTYLQKTEEEGPEFLCSASYYIMAWRR